ncbi:MAG: hypothetical protein P8X86_07435 [Desulfofustis sp.]|jgi:hypothetical protein
MTMMTKASWYAAACLAALSSSSLVHAGEADVIEARVDQNAAGTYDFSVTVQHADEGWNHYADKWEVLDDQGRVVATRVLHHPHVNEQPFTRGLTGVTLPGGRATYSVRAHDSVHDYGGQEVTVDLP